MAEPEVVDVERTPLLSAKEQRRPQYSGSPIRGDGEGKVGARSNAGEEENALLTPSSGHHPWIDVTRIACVWLVAVDHGAPSFGRYDQLFGQQWVLQFLFLVCGVCYGMSRRSLFSYELRLAQYVVIGIIINWSAWIVTGQDWQHNFFGVVFHFWFVVGLMLYVAILSPLKPYLQRIRDAEPKETPEDVGTEPAERSQQQDRRDSLLYSLLLIGGGLLGIMLVFTVVMAPVIELAAPAMLSLSALFGTSTSFWGLPQDLQGSRQFLEHMSTYFMGTAGNVYLLVVCPMVLTRKALTPWALLLYTYGHRLLFYRASDERPFHGLDLMTIALAVYYLGLLHRRRLGEYVIRYWFVVLFGCALLWPPGADVRFDETPPMDISTRIRVNLLEAIFVIVWLVAGDRMVQREIFAEDKLDFLNLWALVVFLVHKAVHIVFVSPLNWIVLLGLAPACYYIARTEPGS